MARKSDTGLTPVILVLYAVPAFVFALPTIPVFVNLPALYGVELGLGLTAVGIALLIARVFDTVTDPLIGALSDRFNFKGARRKPWIAIGAMIAGLGLYKILNPAPGVETAYLLSWSIVLFAGWTMVAVPYAAWGAELSQDYNERTRITSVREGMSLLGILGAAALTAALTQMGWTEADAAGAIAWAAIGIGALVLPPLLWRVPDRAPEARPEPLVHTGIASLLGKVRRGLRTLGANKLFLRLLFAWFINALANGIPAVLFILYLDHGLGVAEADRGIFILSYFAAAIVAIPLWLKLSRAYGKHRVWCWAMVLACAAFAPVPLIPEGGFAAFTVVCILTGMALGADLALPPAMQADVVDYDRWRFGRPRAGLQFAFWGMSTKLALALAAGIALPGLDALGFDAEALTADGRTALIFMYALLPAVIKGIAVYVIWRFPLTARKHAAVQRRLAVRKP